MKRIFLCITFIVALTANAGVNGYAAGKCLLGIAQFEYKKIGITEVPADILKSLTERYKGFMLNEAWISEEEGFRLKLSHDGKQVTSFYKSTGEFIKDDVK